MKDDVIFVHIPKTGGTTINTAMQGVSWGTEVSFNYRHLASETKKSNAGDIFKNVNQEKYQDYKIFTMVRHPVDRLLSEYYFIKHRPSFMKMIKYQPKSIEEYANSKQTQNGMITFLKGRTFYSKVPAKEIDLDDVISAIDNLPVHVGIFEHFAESMAYFKDVTKLDFGKKMEVKRMTFKRPKASEISDALKELIINKNQLDLALYNHCDEKFKSIKSKYQNSKFTFNADKYTHVVPFCHTWCLFDFYFTNPKFRKSNNDFLKKLNFYLLNQLNIKDGRIFTDAWNKSFLKAVEMNFPDSPFVKAIQPAFQENLEPLEELDLLSQKIDQFYKKNKNQPPLQFDSSMVVVPSPQKKGIKKLFGRMFKS